MFRTNILFSLDKHRTGNSNGPAQRRQLLSHSSLINKLTLEAELEGHEGCVNRLAWNETGTLLASVSDDCTLRIWDIRRYKCDTVINTGHTRNIFGVSFIPGTSDRCLATGAMDHRVRVHVTQEDGRSSCMRVFAGHTNRVKHIETVPSEHNTFWSASEDGTIAQYDLRTPPLQPQTHRRSANTLIDIRAGTRSLSRTSFSLSRSLARSLARARARSL